MPASAAPPESGTDMPAPPATHQHTHVPFLPSLLACTHARNYTATHPTSAALCLFSPACARTHPPADPPNPAPNLQVLDEFKAEVGIMKRLRHPNIIQFVSLCPRAACAAPHPALCLAAPGVCCAGPRAKAARIAACFYPFLHTAPTTLHTLTTQPPLPTPADGRLHLSAQPLHRHPVCAPGLPLQAPPPHPSLPARRAAAAADGVGRGARHGACSATGSSRGAACLQAR